MAHQLILHEISESALDPDSVLSNMQIAPKWMEQWKAALEVPDRAAFMKFLRDYTAASDNPLIEELRQQLSRSQRDPLVPEEFQNSAQNFWDFLNIVQKHAYTHGYRRTKFKPPPDSKKAIAPISLRAIEKDGKCGKTAKQRVQFLTVARERIKAQENLEPVFEELQKYKMETCESIKFWSPGKLKDHSLEEHQLHEDRSMNSRKQLQSIVTELIKYMQWIREAADFNVHGFILGPLFSYTIFTGYQALKLSHQRLLYNQDMMTIRVLLEAPSDANLAEIAGGLKHSDQCCWCLKHGELKQCATCKVTRYCSKKCQELGWKIHKRQCGLLLKRKRMIEQQQQQ